MCIAGFAGTKYYGPTLHVGHRDDRGPISLAGPGPPRTLRRLWPMITECSQRSFYEYLRPRSVVKCGILYQNVCPFVPPRHSTSRHRTSPTTSAGRQMSRLDIVCVRPRHRLWLCAVRGCRRTATELSRLAPRESGTVCQITSRLHSHCLFSAVV